MISLAVSVATAAPLPPTMDTPPVVEAWRGQVDWRIAGDEAVKALSAYLQVDTINPPGNEDRGVAWLGEQLDADGISWRTLEVEPGRSSLIARLPGAGKAPPLCLMHHIDVAGVEAERWTEGRGPLSGAIEDGYVWGRGALDMKGMGIVELQTMRWLARLKVPLDRDVILLAVADEEVSNKGARQLAEPDVWKDIGCSHMINEGGLGIRDALFDGQAVHAISTAEKGALWVRVDAEGKAGHGSVPRGDEEAPQRLLDAMDALAGYHPEYRVDPSLYRLLSNVGHEEGGLTGMVLRSKFLVRTVAWSKLRSNATTNAAMHDTMHLTGMMGAHEPNVVPSVVSAQYDCRLLPGTTPEEHLARMRKLVKGVDGITVTPTFELGSSGSPEDDDFYRIIAHFATEDRERAVAGPFLSVGFTDSLLLRPLGVNAYGYVPFEVSAEVAETMHGHDERVPVEEVADGLRRMFSIVVAAAATPGAPTSAPESQPEPDPEPEPESEPEPQPETP
ncbi:MAG: M20/M25/M40 family metallo-hydrolase [Alphaproteobacteria bacterium]|nr:M20/M25/M40 family metallo-hydrolase [Alphaproteobacteria bacterium]MCB9698395.1 M20/M25/M40 family metallo-hydrolase [Alphaproteobacteria bacterium]